MSEREPPPLPPPPPAPVPPELAQFYTRAMAARADLTAWLEAETKKTGIPYLTTQPTREGGERELPGAERAAQEAAQRERQRETTP